MDKLVNNGIICQVNEELTEEMKLQLEEIGFEYHSHVGTVVTGELCVNNVPALLKLDFILQMEFSDIIYPE